eukprot:1313786-Pleurochrysis_carterae.AAC.1
MVNCAIEVSASVVQSSAHTRSDPHSRAERKRWHVTERRLWERGAMAVGKGREDSGKGARWRWERGAANVDKVQTLGVGGGE